ncbi:MAG: GNAT family N-acetyltransferase [Candidatus Melainabacteria bacterium]|nr:GNAT family N-acetyltransferase [Candidatus Melainabacteria bacterium]
MASHGVLRSFIIKIEKATSADWESILQLLEEAELLTSFLGNETYKTFYVIKEPKSKLIICCFSIDFENKTGILKSYAIKKDFQGKGIGKITANKIPTLAKELGLTKIYATSWEAPGFWRKTLFKEINTTKSKDNYFLKYANHLETKFPRFLKQMKHFVLNINT